MFALYNALPYGGAYDPSDYVNSISESDLAAERRRSTPPELARSRPISSIPVLPVKKNSSTAAPPACATQPVIPHYATHFSHDMPLWHRLRATGGAAGGDGDVSGGVRNHMYSTDLRAPHWYPYEYPFGYITDPTYWLAHPYWGSGYLYYRPFYQAPTGACVMRGKCFDATSPLACANQDNSQAWPFYAGKTCAQLQNMGVKTFSDCRQ